MVPGKKYNADAIVRGLQAVYVSQPTPETMTAYNEVPPAEEDLFEITGVLVVGIKLGMSTKDGPVDTDTYQVIVAQKHLATGFMVAHELTFSGHLLDQLEQMGLEKEATG